MKSEGEPVLKKKISKAKTAFGISKKDPAELKDAEFLALQKSILENPHNSDNWIKSIAYYVDRGLLEGARSQSQKALAVISFTSQKDKLNIWKSYLNLEFHYGSKGALLDVYRQASSACSLENICEHLLSLFKTDSLFEEGDFYVKDLLKKSKNRFVAWKLALDFHMVWREHKKDDENDSEGEKRVKDILRRALQSLPLPKHIEFISHYAKLEYQSKNFDNARINFENLLSNFPRRNDIWSVYIEYEIKHTQEIEYIRTLFERVTSIKKNLKQMKFFLKKYLEFEQKFGDAKSQQYVKTKAQAFVENYISQQPKEENEE